MAFSQEKSDLFAVVSVRFLLYVCRLCTVSLLAMYQPTQTFILAKNYVSADRYCFGTPISIDLVQKAKEFIIIEENEGKTLNLMFIYQWDTINFKVFLLY